MRGGLQVENGGLAKGEAQGLGGTKQPTEKKFGRAHSRPWNEVEIWGGGKHWIRYLKVNGFTKQVFRSF